MFVQSSEGGVISLPTDDKLQLQALVLMSSNSIVAGMGSRLTGKWRERDQVKKVLKRFRGHGQLFERVLSFLMITQGGP